MFSPQTGRTQGSCAPTGNQVGCRFWDLVLREHAHVSKGAVYDAALGEGQMGSALVGSLQIICFLTEGLFGYSR